MLTTPDWYKTLIDTMIEGVILVDATAPRRIVYANSTAERVLCLVPSADPARKYENMSLRVLREDGSPLPPDEFITAQVLQYGEMIRYMPVGLGYPDGTTVWLSANAAPIKRDGQIIGIVVTFNDVSSLRASQEKYQSLVENITEVVFTLNAEMIITYVSPVCKQVFGYAPEELIGKHISVVFDAAQARRGKHNARRIMAGEDVGPNVYQVHTKSGEHLWVRITSRPLMEHGQVVGIQGVLIDITELKELQQRYEHTLHTIGEALRQVGNHRPAPHLPLKQRERAVLCLVAKGLNNAEIAQELGLSEKTVGNRLTRLYEKTGTSNRVQLTLYAQSNGLSNPPPL